MQHMLVVDPDPSQPDNPNILDPANLPPIKN
jgi:hypothetical protein